MEQKKEFCPMCPKGCEKGAVRCERGKEYFQAGGEGQTSRAHGFTGHDKSVGHGFHHGRGHRHFEDQLPPDSLAGLLMRSGHYLFRFLHGNNEDLDKAFYALSECERMELKSLLTRLIASWDRK